MSEPIVAIAFTRAMISRNIPILSFAPIVRQTSILPHRCIALFPSKIVMTGPGALTVATLRTIQTISHKKSRNSENEPSANNNSYR